MVAAAMAAAVAAMAAALAMEAAVASALALQFPLRRRRFRQRELLRLRSGRKRKVSWVSFCSSLVFSSDVIFIAGVPLGFALLSASIDGAIRANIHAVSKNTTSFLGPRMESRIYALLVL